MTEQQRARCSNLFGKASVVLDGLFTGGSASDSKYPAAAVRILREARGTAMHYRDITTRALALGLIVATGKTPESTMNGQLNTSPGFVANGKGYYVRQHLYAHKHVIQASLTHSS